MQDNKPTYGRPSKPIRYIASQFFILKDAQVNSRDAKRELIILAGLTLVWALSIWADNHQEFSLAEGPIFALHCFVVLSVQCLIYVIFFLLAKKQLLHRIIPLLIVTVFSVANFYLLILILNKHIAIMGAAPKLLLLMVLFAISLIVLKKFRDMGQSPLLMSLLILVLLLATSGNFFWNQHKRNEQLAELAKIPDHFTFPQFKQRSNVYILFFDALIPEAISRKFLGIDKLEYMSVMRNENLHILKNVFADRVSTNSSINSFIAMDLSHYENTPTELRYLFDTGKITGPLYELFKRNDYKIQIIIPSPYFGPTSESNIDFYGVFDELGLCETESNDYALLGYCLPAVLKLRQRLLGRSDRSYIPFLYNRITKASKPLDRWLTLVYIRRPGHVKKSFYIDKPGDLEEYASEFKAWRAPHAAIGMQKIFEFIRNRDPNSVVVILGDHGAWLSNGLDKMAPEKRPMDPIEYFQDRFGVAAAVYPKGFCFDEFEKVSSLARIGRVIVKCLSGGIDPLPPEYQPDDEHLREYFYE